VELISTKRRPVETIDVPAEPVLEG
jgi:hypothetical protein